MQLRFAPRECALEKQNTFDFYEIRGGHVLYFPENDHRLPIEEQNSYVTYA